MWIILQLYVILTTKKISHCQKEYSIASHVCFNISDVCHTKTDWVSWGYGPHKQNETERTWL